MGHIESVDAEFRSTGCWYPPAWWQKRDPTASWAPRGVEVDAATAELARLYPPDVVRDLISRQEGLAFVCCLSPASAGIYSPHMRSLIRLGDDLARCDGWTDSQQLKKQLQNPATWGDARVEVGVWANLARAGLQVEHEPTAGGLGQPRPGG